VLSKRVVTTHLIEGLSNAEERALLTRVFVTKDAALGDEAIEALSPEAKVVNRLLGGVPLDEARILADQLPDSVIATLHAISPISKIEDLEARVLIMHDRQDRLVPSEESRRLAEDLADRGGVSHTEFSLFQHLDPTRPVSPPVYVRELFKLYMHMYRVLREWD
jgi:pimeloyl-ACP methyl ester carboxylesterase